MSRKSETARRIHVQALRDERIGIERRIEVGTQEGDDALVGRLTPRLDQIDRERMRVGDDTIDDETRERLSAPVERATRGRNRETRQGAAA